MGVPLAEPAARALARPGRRALAAAAATAVLVVAGIAALAAVRPPEPAGPDAPAGRFSAGRAFGHVTRIAAQPHVAGSAANDAVREHVAGTLRGLGLAVEIQDTVAAEGGTLSASAGLAGLARVRNVVATLPGTAPTGRIILVAHYDSVQVGPGGNDDGAGTSAVLEVARALTAGERLRNDVVLLLTDAEEACLCGASAYAERERGRGGVVLNLEARGSSGPAVMFETSADNAALVGAYAGVPHPVGTSFAVEVYRLLPNDTDFTPFRLAGFAGLNSAYIDGAAVYHTPLDTPAAMDTASLQHHGDNALALVRDLGGRDLATLRAGGDATYFPTPWGLARYPGALTWPLAGLALAAALALGFVARRRGLTSWPRVAAGFALALVPLAGGPVAAQALWAGVLAVEPGYAELLDPYEPLFFRLAVLALTAAVLFAWYTLLRRRVGPAGLAIGAVLWLAVLALVLAAVTPGGSYLAALPALATAGAGLAAVAVRGRWAVALLAAAAAVAVTLLLPTIWLLFPALGMATGGAAALFAVLLSFAALPVLDLLLPEAGGQRGLGALAARRLAPVPASLALVLAAACTVAGVVANAPGPDRPSPTHLMYALDADTNEAVWLSAEDDPQEWTAGYVSSAPAERSARFPALGPALLRSGPAQPAALPAPEVVTEADTRAGDVRTLRLRITPRRPVRLLAVRAEGEVAPVRAVVAGRELAVDRGGFGFVLHAPPPGGVVVELSVRGAGPVTLRVMDASDGLSALPGFRPRPADVGIDGSHSSEMAGVARTVRL
ncbi:M28 family peptidase [Spirilliplanes yamanashiensis]|uniref:Vacuolar membrane protease n=1 Tax=Spirilliplanes yamanashiensis TaxID=42233 RepID=A0A8J3Y9J4_9ACTN|nr:M28 family peptidase [Spirilliplanes yamanashiensis]MDP9815755.1 Zn-dependent M28 family amino/carboxypeptidase [Spirilliplanes yamanashiensis]GIJ04009.1 aminopeptidase [Spirilliplanes yamanashiensis]